MSPSTPKQAAPVASHPPHNANAGPWFAISLALMGVIVGYGVGSTQGTRMTGTVPTVAEQPTAKVPAAEPVAETPPSMDDDPVLGNADAPITLVEFTDYQCPYCARHFSETYGQIKQNYIDTGKVKLVVRDYPLSFHANAQKAAEASECADDQGKFWEMHDKLFGGMGEWSNLPGTSAVTTFKTYAEELELDADEFASCIDDGTHATEIQQDLADGSDSGISGTPGFWIIDQNGKGQKISGAYPYATFQAAFDALL